MLDVQSPIPLTEGETLAFGVTTKHAAHFVIGLGISSPVAGLVALVSSQLGISPWSGVLCSVMLGVAFATIPWKGRTLSDIGWLSLRYLLRPKVLLYDRLERTWVHRTKEGSR